MPKRRGVDGRMQIRPWGDTGDPYWLGYQKIDTTDRTTSLPATDTTLTPANPLYAPFDDTFTSGRADAFAARIKDVRVGTLRFVNASWSDEANMFGPPLYIAAGRYYEVWLYQNQNIDEILDFIIGTYNSTLVWHYLGSLLCVSSGVTMIIPGGQPVSIDFETDGSYRGPNEMNDRMVPVPPVTPPPPEVLPAPHEPWPVNVFGEPPPPEPSAPPPALQDPVVVLPYLPWD